MNSENRIAVRYVFESRIAVTVSRGSRELVAPAWARDLSESGLGAFAAENLSVGESVTLQIPLPPGEKQTVTATVTRKLGAQYGFQFTTLSPEQRLAIQEATRGKPAIPHPKAEGPSDPAYRRQVAKPNQENLLSPMIEQGDGVGTLKVLVLGKDIQMLEMIRTSLQDMGVKERYSSLDPAPASAILRKDHFDGIILDCDHFDAALEILATIRRGPSNRQVPVMAVVRDEDAMRAIQNAGAPTSVSVDLYLKPRFECI